MSQLFPKPSNGSFPPSKWKSLMIMPEQAQPNLSLCHLPNVFHNHCPLTLSDPAVLAFLLFSNRPSKESASGHLHLLLPLLEILSSQISMWLMPSFLSALCPNVTLSLWPPLAILYELKTHFPNLSRGLYSLPHSIYLHLPILIN